MSIDNRPSDRTVTCSRVMYISVLLALSAGTLLLFRFSRDDHSVDVIPKEFDPIVEEPNSFNTVWLNPHIIPVRASGCAFFDGGKYYLCLGRSDGLLEVPLIRAVMQDASVVRGQDTYVVFQKGIKIFQELSSEASSVFMNPPGMTVLSAVIDAPRERVFTLECDTTLAKSRIASVRRASLDSQLQMRSLSGQSLSIPYHFSEPCRVLARDSFCDRLIVGASSGRVHVFRVDTGGASVLAHHEFNSGSVVGASCLGEVAMIAFEKGVGAITVRGSSVDARMILDSNKAGATGSASGNDLVFSARVINSDWALCSQGKTLHCVDLSSLVIRKEISLPGVVRGLCAAFDENEAAVLLDHGGGSVVWIVNVVTGEIDMNPFSER